MPYLHLKNLDHGALYLTGFATYPELRAARDRAKAKEIVIVYWGEASKVKPWQAQHWVYKADYTSFGMAFQDYQYPIHQGKKFSTPLGSFQSALDKIGRPEYVIVYKGKSIPFH